MHILGRKLGRFWTEIDFKFEPRDIWIGVYWKRYPQGLDMYFCVLPMLPLEIYIEWN